MQMVLLLRSCDGDVVVQVVPASNVGTARLVHVPVVVEAVIGPVHLNAPVQVLGVPESHVAGETGVAVPEQVPAPVHVKVDAKAVVLGPVQL